uniref:BAG domain protein n=1 Tax=Pithovirus LCPAC102 TaxID=2506587 RepID=A0A481Z3S2_9VIRU|nr:MAG: BAG domain protein [Pithovirus LCPAC102]
MFTEFDINLDNAMEYINTCNKPSYKLPSILDEQKQWIESLSLQLLKLDEIDGDINIKNDRKQYILATQSIITQIEHLFTTKKNILMILSSDKSSERISYNPINRNTHYQYFNVYDQGSIYQ